MQNLTEYIYLFLIDSALFPDEEKGCKCGSAVVIKRPILSISLVKIFSHFDILT